MLCNRTGSPASPDKHEFPAYLLRTMLPYTDLRDVPSWAFTMFLLYPFMLFHQWMYENISALRLICVDPTEEPSIGNNGHTQVLVPYQNIESRVMITSPALRESSMSNEHPPRSCVQIEAMPLTITF